MLSVLAYIPSIVIVDRGMIPNGLGQDVWTLGFDKITNFARFLYASEILYVVHVTIVKLTLLLFFLRIFQKPMTQWLIKATIAFNILSGSVYLVAVIFQCQPIWQSWTSWDKEHSSKCISMNALVWSYAAVGLLVDIWMLIIPLYEVFHLHLPLYKKLSVCVMFGFGTFATIISVIRLRYLIYFAASTNQTWDQYEIFSWSITEVNIGNFCACLPALRSMGLHISRNLFGIKDTSRPSYGASTHGNKSGARKRGFETELMKTETDEEALVRVVRIDHQGR